jgi:cyclophilin family peptidyl-prolyl cis-trans isomerase
MKRLLAILLAFALVFGLTACNEGNSGSDDRDRRERSSGTTAADSTDSTDVTDVTTAADAPDSPTHPLVGTWQEVIDDEFGLIAVFHADGTVELGFWEKCCCFSDLPDSIGYVRESTDTWVTFGNEVMVDGKSREFTVSDDGGTLRLRNDENDTFILERRDAVTWDYCDESNPPPEPPQPPSDHPAFNGQLQGRNGNVQQVNLRRGDTYAVIDIRGHGEIVVALFPDVAPLAVQNFVDLATSRYYDGKIFHRIIPNFMIQGGSPFGDGRGDPNFQGFDTEPSSRALHIYGAISTANTGQPRSNGQQFFIVNTDATPHLNGLHTVFGQVVDGFDVLDAVSRVATGAADRPVTDVVINRVTIHTFG